MELYQHYKGGLYVVVTDDASDSTNPEGPGTNESRLVVYYSLEQGAYRVRDHAEFFGPVGLDGSPRFRRVKYPSNIAPVRSGHG